MPLRPPLYSCGPAETRSATSPGHGSKLPINIDNLLHQRGVEGNRVEFKGSWNEGRVVEQVLHTICAFANDYLDTNGGYIVLGVEERSGVAALPPKGLDRERLTAIQKSIRGQCRRLEPRYEVIASHEVVAGRDLLVLWVPASEDRPHAAPVSRNSKERRTYIRLGAETVEADQRQLQELIRRKGKAPFDDRPAPDFVLEDLRSSLVREFLREVRSGLLDEPDDVQIYRRLKLTARLNGHEVPRNIALMFFSDEPERAFPGARIEVVRVARGGDVLPERNFRGPLHRQLHDSVSYLEQWIGRQVEKVAGRAESEIWSSYPFGAVEEAIGNAVHHRGYDDREPTKVRLFDDRMEITSYPGPVPGIEAEHLEPEAQPPLVPGRNRRIGELLKELGLVEMWGTGVRKIHRTMVENGSPPPRFEFDEERTYFRVVLPIHPGAAPPASRLRTAARRDGLVLVSIGAESIQPVVEASLAALELSDARVLIDHSAPDYLDADPERFEAEAKRIRNALREPIEDPEVAQLHLFYRGPVAIGPLLGALLATSAKPVVVYHYHDGRYTRAYVLDRRFLKTKD